MDRRASLSARLEDRIRDEVLASNECLGSAAGLDRVRALLPMAIDAFERPEIAFVWFTSPNALLGEAIPVYLILGSELDTVKVRRILVDICRTR